MGASGSDMRDGMCPLFTGLFGAVVDRDGSCCETV